MSSLIGNRWEHDDELHWMGEPWITKWKPKPVGLSRSWLGAGRQSRSIVCRDGWLSTSRSSQPWATHLSIIHISAVSITSENCFSWSMMIILLYTHPTFSCISCTSALPSPCRSRGATVILPATNGLDSTRSTMETCASGAECFSRKSSWWGQSGRRGLALYCGTSETQRI